jgi:hypothetical protein
MVSSCVHVANVVENIHNWFILGGVDISALARRLEHEMAILAPKSSPIIQYGAPPTRSWLAYNGLCHFLPMQLGHTMGENDLKLHTSNYHQALTGPRVSIL